MGFGCSLFILGLVLKGLTELVPCTGNYEILSRKANSCFLVLASLHQLKSIKHRKVFEGIPYLTPLMSQAHTEHCYWRPFYVVSHLPTGPVPLPKMAAVYHPGGEWRWVPIHWKVLWDQEKSFRNAIIIIIICYFRQHGSAAFPCHPLPGREEGIFRCLPWLSREEEAVFPRNSGASVEGILVFHSPGPVGAVVVMVIFGRSTRGLQQTLGTVTTATQTPPRPPRPWGRRTGRSQTEGAGPRWAGSRLAVRSRIGYAQEGVRRSDRPAPWKPEEAESGLGAGSHLWAGSHLHLRRGGGQRSEVRKYLDSGTISVFWLHSITLDEKRFIILSHTEQNVT